MDTSKWVWLAEAGGALVQPVVNCPKDGARVVYNGNYFCEFYDRGFCDWALSHPVTSTADKKFVREMWEKTDLDLGYD